MRREPSHEARLTRLESAFLAWTTAKPLDVSNEQIRKMWEDIYAIRGELVLDKRRPK